MKGLTTMYDYKWKKAGVVLSVAGLAAMIGERTSPFIVFNKLTPMQHYGVFECLMLLGLFLIVFCREKDDDERAKAIRAKSFQIAFTLMLSILLSIGFSSSILKEFQIDSSILLQISAFGIFAYLLIFNLGLYFDFLWEYDDKGVLENLRNVKKHIWAKLAYLAIGAIIILILALLPYA